MDWKKDQQLVCTTLGSYPEGKYKARHTCRGHTSCLHGQMGIGPLVSFTGKFTGVRLGGGNMKKLERVAGS